MSIPHNVVYETFEEEHPSIENINLNLLNCKTTTNLNSNNLLNQSKLIMNFLSQ